MDLNPEPEQDGGFHRASFMTRLGRYMEQRGLSTDWDSAEATDHETLINSMSMLLPLAPRKSRHCWNARP